MTKELYNKCRNPLKQAFCALDAETQAALKEAAAGGNAEYLHAHSGLWDGVVPGDLGKGRVYRISDKAAPPPEPQWVDAPVSACDNTGSGLLKVQVSFDQNKAVAAGVRLAFVPYGACRACAVRQDGSCLVNGTRLSLLCMSCERADGTRGAWKEVRR